MTRPSQDSNLVPLDSESEDQPLHDPSARLQTGIYVFIEQKIAFDMFGLGADYT